MSHHNIAAFMCGRNINHLWFNSNKVGKYHFNSEHCKKEISLSVVEMDILDAQRVVLI